MSKVFVIDSNKQPLNPVHPGWARKLLSSGKAAVFKRYPFTIILKCAIASPRIEPLRVKADPGSKTTGLALINDATGEVIWAAELSHRAHIIADKMKARGGQRRGRRSRKTRYRAKRFLYRAASARKGLKQPSLRSRVSNIVTWVKRLMRVAPISAISMELVKFDMQKLENPDMSGEDYQHGTLWKSELMKYLLEKWEHTCAYCGISDRDGKDFRWEADHFIARSKGGADGYRNRVLSCGPCNIRKGNMDAREFLKDQPERLARIQAHMKAPLKDAAAVNATRRELFERLKRLRLPVECGSGGRTRWNRMERGLSKTHWIDAACVGKSTPTQLQVKAIRPLLIAAMGHGNRQICQTDKYGFPKKHRQRKRRHFGFRSGDVVKATLLPSNGYRGKKFQGVRTDRITVQANGSFYFGTRKDKLSFKYTFCQPIHRNDGYSYRVQAQPGLKEQEQQSA